MWSGSARVWPPRKLLRALLAIVALVSQLTLGSLVLPDASSAASLDAVTILCASASAGTPAPAQHHPRPVDQPLGELAAALTLPALLLLSSVFHPSRAPATMGRRFVALPPARGPPQRLAWALHVRGPPILA